MITQLAHHCFILERLVLLYCTKRWGDPSCKLWKSAIGRWSTAFTISCDDHWCPEMLTLAAPWSLALDVYMLVQATGVSMLIILIAMVYSTASPLVSIVTCIYFLTSFIVWRYHLLFMYIRAYESGGQMWPVLFSKMVVRAHIALWRANVQFPVLSPSTGNTKGILLRSGVLMDTHLHLVSLTLLVLHSCNLKAWLHVLSSDRALNLWLE